MVAVWLEQGGQRRHFPLSGAGPWGADSASLAAVSRRSWRLLGLLLAVPLFNTSEGSLHGVVGVELCCPPPPPWGLRDPPQDRAGCGKSRALRGLGLDPIAASEVQGRARMLRAYTRYPLAQHSPSERFCSQSCPARTADWFSYRSLSLHLRH